MAWRRDRLAKPAARSADGSPRTTARRPGRGAVLNRIHHPPV